MSYQSQLPIMTQAPPGAGAPLPKGKRRKGLMILGIVLLVGGLGGGLATAGKGLSNYKDAVKSLAPLMLEMSAKILIPTSFSPMQ